jgi:hypothetical protein
MRASHLREDLAHPAQAYSFLGSKKTTQPDEDFPDLSTDVKRSDTNGSTNLPSWLFTVSSGRSTFLG